MMNGTMDSMMSGVMGFGWLPALLALVLVIGGLVMVAHLLRPAAQEGLGLGNLVLGILAVVGGIALVAILAMGTMHFGMRCC
jgi:hypothetical protein